MNKTGEGPAPRQMTDLHMHVIPGVDDGAYDRSMAEIMLAMAYTQGVRAVFATPHSSAFFYARQRVEEQFRELRAWLDASPMDMELYLGCEVRCMPDGMPSVITALRQGVLPTLNGTRYVLTEFDTGVRPAGALRMTEGLLEEGWIPVIAHVERYPALFDGHTPEELVRRGCLLQINAYSLAGETDQAIVGRARALLADGRVSFLGSDAHRLNHRPPDVRAGLDYVYAACDPAYADAVTHGNARRLIRAEKSCENAGGPPL